MVSDRIAFARISTSLILIDEAIQAVGDDASGAVVSFTGVVRDHDDGRTVASLDYEGHPTATDAIERVALQVADEFPMAIIAVEHRVGHLVVGDVALACAVSSPHRSEAFAACSRLVELVKAEVPIWKEQRFTDGTSEWVASLG